MEEFINALGARVAHCTAVENLPGIEEHGLLPPAETARRIGVDPRSIALRPERTVLTEHGYSARLNHQKPILHGRAAAESMVDGHSARSWAEFLDERIFLWPEAQGSTFARSIDADLELATIWLDTRKLLKEATDAIFLSPINSGNFRQGGANARRGEWLFVPITAGLEAFRANRKDRGLVRARDRIKEVSLTRGLSPETLARLRVG